MFGVISGSGLYNIPGLDIVDSIKVSTPYGEPSDVYRKGNLSGKEIIFLPRHGTPHYIQPHKINYRANIWGFRELGVKKIISIGASGGISNEMKPGSIVALNQLIDFTRGRQSTFYDDNEVIHIDFTEPFCPDLREYILKASDKVSVDIASTGTYICTNGPRLETEAEIKAFSRLGADMVGMTLMPEAVLARELEICFAGISIITNRAAGISGKKLTVTEVIKTMQTSIERVKLLLESFFAMDFSLPACLCEKALDDTKM